MRESQRRMCSDNQLWSIRSSVYGLKNVNEPLSTCWWLYYILGCVWFSDGCLISIKTDLCEMGLN